MTVSNRILTIGLIASATSFACFFWISDPTLLGVWSVFAAFAMPAIVIRDRMFRQEDMEGEASSEGENELDSAKVDSNSVPPGRKFAKTDYVFASKRHAGKRRRRIVA